MVDASAISRTAGTLLLYLSGVGIALGGAVILLQVVVLSVLLGVVLFLAGLGLVVYVHESLGGPL